VTSDLTDLYQEVILDHNRSPQNFRRLEQANRVAEGLNPLCGDQITIYVDLDGDVIRDIGFQGHGCAIAKASASIMTASVKGKTVAEARSLFQGVHRMLTADRDAEDDDAHLGKLVVLGGIRRFPVRVKCASLSWHALRAALEGERDPVSTE
jgi:nitrogen fixation NifU-like protein